MLPVSKVFHTEVTVSIGLKYELIIVRNYEPTGQGRGGGREGLKGLPVSCISCKKQLMCFFTSA